MGRERGEREGEREREERERWGGREEKERAVTVIALSYGSNMHLTTDSIVICHHECHTVPVTTA